MGQWVVLILQQTPRLFTTPRNAVGGLRSGLRAVTAFPSPASTFVCSPFVSSVVFGRPFFTQSLRRRSPFGAGDIIDDLTARLTGSCTFSAASPVAQHVAKRQRIEGDGPCVISPKALFADENDKENQVGCVGSVLDQSNTCI